MGMIQMGKNEKRESIVSGIPMAIAVALLFTQIACSSAGSQQARVSDEEAPGSAVASARVATPAEIESLALFVQDEAAFLDVAADRALVWTTYRDAEGNLVVELPNSVPGTAVQDLAKAEGLVSGVAVELLEDGDRPLTRLVVRTRDETEHSLTTQGSGLRLQLVPVGYEGPVTLAYEPLAEDQPIAEPLSAPAQAAATTTPPVTRSGDYGTPDAPYVGPPPSGVAATRLTGVEIVESGEVTSVRVSGDGEFVYSTFRLQNPDRFVIDLGGVVNTSPRSTVAVGSAALDQIRIGQFKPRPDPVSRVVFDLRAFKEPHIERSADGLTVTFGGVPTPEMALAEAPASPPPAPLESESLGDDSEPGLEMAEPMAVAETSSPPAADEMASPTAPPSVPVYEPTPEPMPTGEAMAMAEEMPAETAAPPAAAPPSVSRPVSPRDVALFEAQEVSVEPPGEAEQSVLPRFANRVISREDREYIGEPISMSLKNADLVETLRSFSRISDLNFVIQPSVTGSVTVELHSVPWDQALEQILKINNLGMDIDGTIVRIAPMRQLREEAEEARRIAQERARTVPLRTVMRSLSYAEANDVARLLRSSANSNTILSARGTVQVDQRTNTLILRELPNYIDTVLAVIENLDTPEPQVKIESRIIEATKSFGRTIGIQWNYDAVADARHGNTTGVQFPNNIDSDGGVQLLTGGPNGFLNLSLGNLLNTFNIDATIFAAENEGLINLISAPSVTTLNNEQAQIQSGLQIPIQVVANNTVTVQFINATLQLRVKPHVTAEGTILLDIRVSKREPQLAFAIVGATNAPIATREARTKVIVRDGGTAVIGGIYEVSTNQNQDRVPGLASIPILGHLFKNRNRTSENEELLIFVTPRIVQL